MTELYVVQVHPVAALQVVGRLCRAAGGRRRAALVSCGHPAAPAPLFGQGHRGAEEELCRLLPLLHEQLLRLPYPLAPGDVHRTRTLIGRSVFNYSVETEPEPVWVLTMGVPDMRAQEWKGQELSPAWHVAVRTSARAVLRAAHDAHLTDLVLSNDACSELANPAAAFFGAVCDVLRCEFSGAFDTVGFAVRAGEHTHLVECRLAASRLMADPDPEQARQLAEQLDGLLQKRFGWSDTQGEPVAQRDLAAAACADLAQGDARSLALAASVLHADGRLDWHPQSGQLAVCRGLQ